MQIASLVFNPIAKIIVAKKVQLNQQKRLANLL
jgi:hypothetical protein